MRGSEQAQVDLQGEVAPGIAGTLAACEEVDAEPRHDPFFRQHHADAVRHASNGQPVVVVGRKSAPKIGLSERPAENLVVRGDLQHFPPRAGAELHRGRPFLWRLDVLFHDPAHPSELVEEGRAGGFRGHRELRQGGSHVPGRRGRVGHDSISLP